VNEAAFYFARQLVAGKITGFESYRVDRQDFKPTLSTGELQVPDKLLEAFRVFAAADKNNGLSAENIGSQAEYARSRIRLELATASFSTEAGVQVLLERDPQIAKAIEAMPQAAKLKQTVAYSRTSQ
jgi:hypothetical protein